MTGDFSHDDVVTHHHGDGCVPPHDDPDVGPGGGLVGEARRLLAAAGPIDWQVSGLPGIDRDAMAVIEHGTSHPWRDVARSPVRWVDARLIAAAPRLLAGLADQVAELERERDMFSDEVEFAVNGGTDVDGPLPGLDGLDLLGKINVLHHTAVRVAELEAGIRELHVPRDEEVERFHGVFPEDGDLEGVCPDADDWGCVGHMETIQVCRECGHDNNGDSAFFRAWPCPTVALLDGFTHTEGTSEAGCGHGPISMSVLGHCRACDFADTEEDDR